MFTTNTHFGWGRFSDTLRKRWNSFSLACYVNRCKEAVAPDTIFSNTPAHNSGTKAAQLFAEGTSLFCGYIRHQNR
jgi:hypothetical protein